ncbi:hypothetical protein ACIRQP_30280 [Streptomyces sp. NPDC102274]|uniref:hypothetical protein n=1 Tax=Streptomyces sp. NPDC102274 TaxID=3366151 RepID=UPI00381A0FFE
MDRFVAHTGIAPAASATYHWFRISRVAEAPCATGRSGDADGDREGGPAQQMEKSQ